ncbi:DUF4861 domain-containing protein [Pareuzebyella sediminis]|uniref:DUF4861 domain-containing protein n=1 Tax=Pareuzebyella sediminis TaxID=2607998 RepID=UPI001E61BA90|nr:DUF4861 domain-containing protein [Pareuzebyella sediminis]
MNKSFFFILLITLGSCTSERFQQEILVHNTSQFSLNDKPIRLRRKLLRVPNDSLGKNPVITFKLDTIPCQINDLDDDGIWDELFFVVDFNPNESKSLDLDWATGPFQYPIKTSVRFGKRVSAKAKVQPEVEEVMMADELPLTLGYQQYQTDGPSWENDKVGFRHYLDGRNAKDLFGKKTHKMSPETVGINKQGAVEDNYHVMEDWGRDILAVGNSVGLGGYALRAKDTLMRLGVTVDDSISNVARTTFKILAEGPVNSVLEYHYENWKPNDRSYTVHETTSIWPGMYGYQNTVSVQGLRGDEELAIGLVNINNDAPLEVIEENEEFVMVYTHDKQSYEKEWWLGMALILPKSHYMGYIEAPKKGQLSNTFLAQMKIQENQPVQYYAIGAWELSHPKFADRDAFKSYVVDLAHQLSAEIDVKINN